MPIFYHARQTAVWIRTHSQYVTYFFALAGPNDVDEFRVRVDEENVLRFEVGMWQLVGM